MKMNLAAQCIILLACMAIYGSAAIIKCRCLTSSDSVKPSLITDIQIYLPRPYCKNHEVIVTLKNGSERCLNPNSKFTKALLERLEKMKSGDQTTISPRTTIASTTGEDEKWGSDDWQPKNIHSVNHHTKVIIMHFTYV